MKKHGLALILLGFFVSSSAVDFSTINVAWQYDPLAEIRVAHRVYQNGEGLNVLLHISADSLGQWGFELYAQNGYESESQDTITSFLVDTLSYSLNNTDLALLFTDLKSDLLVLRFFKHEKSYFYDVATKIGTLSFPTIYPKNDDGLPIYSNYINRTGFSWEGSDSLHVLQYRETFARADPPMAEMKPIAPNVKRDSVFTASTIFTMKDDHFYMVRNDSNQSTGVTILRVPPYFPESRQLTELVASMLYLTSEPEEKSLLKSQDLKKDFDGFWINNLGSRPKARAAIRRYYTSVKLANTFFTDFKPGWKTDRGMMFIIYGKPDEVYRLNGLEEWYYDSGEAFEFNVISSFFAPRTYSLRRTRNFEEGWFLKVGEIRKGIR